MLKFVMIATGGAVGAILRYAISGWAQKFANGSFPVGTLFVNMLACPRYWSLQRTWLLATRERPPRWATS